MPQQSRHSKRRIHFHLDTHLQLLLLVQTFSDITLVQVTFRKNYLIHYQKTHFEVIDQISLHWGLDLAGPSKKGKYRDSTHCITSLIPYSHSNNFQPTNMKSRWKKTKSMKYFSSITPHLKQHHKHYNDSPPPSRRDIHPEHLQGHTILLT